ncbi:MAG: helicase C-terminal domain-containing protein [Treponema sp.]|nr:helicase C-terminal domain-containing protein [Treponema sp.]
MDVLNRFTEEVIEFIKNEIKNADFNEVFFTGQIDESGVIYECKVGSRGTEDTVPVNFSDVRKSSVLIHNHPGGVLKPSNADLGVASWASENAQGFYIINNQVSDVYVVVEPVLPVVIKPVNADDAGFYLSQGGPLSSISESFEERPVQIELLKNIVDTLNKNKLGAFEAGTGVGKSYAYLIPSVLWALENKERVIISTGTINLQQQLCEKDIPAVEKILNREVKFILMKGRQNYICKRRLQDAAMQKDLFEEENEVLEKIAAWALETQTGSKSDLTFFPSETVWSKVNSESDACMGMRCPFHSECFVMKVRKEAASSNIIVVNHHLLFADIDSRMSGAGYEDAVVLPPYKHIVFDEAHGIEAAATSFFSLNFNRFKLNKLIGQMYRRRKNSESGHLFTLALLSSNEEKVTLAYDVTNQIKLDIVKLEILSKDLLQNETTKRLYGGTARDFGPVLVGLNQLAKSLGEFTEIIRIVIEGIDDEDKDVPAMWESKIVLRRLEECVLLIKNFCSWDEIKENVFWIQKKRLPPDMVKDDADADYITFYSTPLDISKMMNSGVYENMNSVVFVSATLKTGRDFRYWMNRTGISFADSERISWKEFPSPFPYEKNMLLAVPNDAPLPDNMQFQQYIEMAIPRLINAAEGRTLVLFTSYESLKSAHNSCRAVLRSFSGRIMRQGEDDNGKLLDAFRREKESVLFATDSFWQGVDIPGDSLSQVIIVKLPFTVPNDPVFVARAEAIEQRGGNSFMELSVPEAVIKFRQGIGRLIRRTDDKGVVTVLDRRLYEKRYGSIFLQSIPECKKIYEPLSEITTRINDFIFS